MVMDAVKKTISYQSVLGVTIRFFFRKTFGEKPARKLIFCLIVVSCLITRYIVVLSTQKQHNHIKSRLIKTNRMNSLFTRKLKSVSF